MRAKTKIYHVECFRCCACMRRLETGDEFALRQDGLFCRHDHDVLEGGKHCTGAASIPGSENNNNASLTNNNHHLHPNDGSMSGKSTVTRRRRNSFLSPFSLRVTHARHVSDCEDIDVVEKLHVRETFLQDFSKKRKFERDSTASRSEFRCRFIVKSTFILSLIISVPPSVFLN